MADASRSLESNACTKAKELPRNRKLINIEPVDDRLQSDILKFDVSPQSNCTSYEAGSYDEEQHLQGDLIESFTTERIRPGIRHICENDLQCEHFAAAADETVQEQNEREKVTGFHSDHDWRLINIEPSDQADSVWAEDRSHEEDLMSLSQPGPSTVQYYGTSNLSVSSKGLNEQTSSTEQRYPWISSTSKQCEEEDLPGPSRIRIHSTILKKSNPDRQSHTGHRAFVQSEHVRLSPHSQVTSTDQKHVHFDPNSECNALKVCERKRMDYIGDRYPSAKEILEKLSSDCEEADVDDDISFESTSNAFCSSVLDVVGTDCENTKVVGTKSTMRRNISIVVNENTSANNTPIEEAPKSLDQVLNPGSDEFDTTHLLAVNTENQESANHQGHLFDSPIDTITLDTTSQIIDDLDSLCLNVTSESENAVIDSDHAAVDHKLEGKPLSHTEKMVALFTNLRVNEISPPQQSEKPRRVKPLEGKVAEYVHCFDERTTKDLDKQNLSIALDKRQRTETKHLAQNSTRVQLCNPETCSQTSGKVVQNLELHREQTRTNKHSVEAVLLVLKSMQSILLRMARIADSNMVGGNETDDLQRDALKTRRKKRPWESAGPKDNKIMPDGPFAYSIAHQVIGQAFRKITELYPGSIEWEQLESDQERDSGDIKPDSVILALTAMKDALRELEGTGAYKLYTSTAVETSDSLTTLSRENESDEHDVLENKGIESRRVVSDILTEMIERVTNGSVDVYEDGNKTDQELLPDRIRTTEGGSRNTELKGVAFELVSRAVREAVSILTKTKAQSVSGTPCDNLLLQTADPENKSVWKNTRTNILLPCSTAAAESMPQEDQPAESLLQSLSSEMYSLISKHFSFLESADCREKNNLVVADRAEKEPSSVTDTVFDNSTVFERKHNSTDGTLFEENTTNLTRTEENDDYTESPQRNIKYLPQAASGVEHTKEENWYTSQSDPETYSQEHDSDNSVLAEELCRSNESTKCINSSSQTTNSSIERLFDMESAPRPRRTSGDQSMVETNSQGTFEYSTPSTLLSLRPGDNGGEFTTLGSAGFGNLIHSSDLIVIPTTVLHMSGGNHPEHVQQADQNRPSCSASPDRQTNPQLPDKAATSKSLTTAAKTKKKTGHWNPTARWHHQTRPSKVLGNLAGNKLSFSEPKLDFYKRTKVLDCPQTRKQVFNSPESNISEWSVDGFYPPRHASDMAAVGHEDSEADENPFGSECDDIDIESQPDCELYMVSGTSFQGSAEARSSGTSNDDEPGCVSTETDLSAHASSEKRNSGSCTVKEKASQTDTDTWRAEFHYAGQGTYYGDQSTGMDDTTSIGDAQKSLASAPDCKCQRLQCCLDTHFCCLRRECSSIHLDDCLLKSKKDSVHKSSEHTDCHQCTRPPSSGHSCGNLRTKTDGSEWAWCKQTHRNHSGHRCFHASPIPHSGCCGQSPQPQLARSQCSQDHSCCVRNCNEEWRNCGCRRRRCSLLCDDVCDNRLTSCEVLAATASEKCPSFDNQRGGNLRCAVRNKNINGVGREFRSSSAQGEAFGASFTPGHDPTVDSVHDKFSQLQSNLKAGLDNLKDFMVALCSSMKSDLASGERGSADWRESNHPPARSRSWCSFCSSPLLPTMPHSLHPCQRHPLPVDGQLCTCPTCSQERSTGERFERKSTTPTTTEPHCSCESSNSCVWACHCCPGARRSGSDVQCPSKRVAGSCSSDDHGAYSRSSHGRSVSYVDVPLYTCIYRLSDSPLVSHSSECHCVCDKSVHKTEQTDIEGSSDCCNHNRICRLHKTRSHRVRKGCSYCTTERSCTSLESVSMKGSGSSLRNSEPGSGLCSKQETAPVPHEYAHSVANIQGEQTDLCCIGSQSDSVFEVSADHRQTSSLRENTDSSSFSESSEPNFGRGNTDHRHNVHIALDTNHSYRVSSSVINTAVNIVETLLNMQSSGQSNSNLREEVASSSVDGGNQSPGNQRVVQSPDSKGSVDSERCTHHVCRDNLIKVSDSVKHNFSDADCEVQTQSNRLPCQSESPVANNNVDYAEQFCICYKQPLQMDACCSDAPVFSCDQCNQEKSVAGCGLCEQKKMGLPCGACARSREQKANTYGKCSETSLKSEKVWGAKKSNENGSNSSSSKCNAFLVCVGEEGTSSAMVIQPLVTPVAVQCRDTACQAGDRSVYTSLEMPFHWAERDTSEMSVANSFLCTLMGEQSEISDHESKKSPRLHEAVTSGSVTNVTCEGRNSFSSLSDSMCSGRGQSRSSNRTASTHRKRKLGKSDSRTSSVYVLNGVCEISHSGCETCQQDPGTHTSDAAAASSHNAEEPTSAWSESWATNYGFEDHKNPANETTNSGYSHEVSGVSESTQTNRIVLQTAGRTASCPSCEYWGVERQNFSKANGGTVISNGTCVPVSALRSNGTSAFSDENENLYCCPVESDSDNVDPTDLRENIQRGSIISSVKGRSSHVDSSLTGTKDVSLDLTETDYSDSCVDSSIVDDYSDDVDSSIRKILTTAGRERSNRQRTGVVKGSEPIGSLKERGNETVMEEWFKSPVACQTGLGSAGGDPSPVNVNGCQFGLNPISDCEEGTRSCGTETGFYVPASESGFFTDTTSTGSGRPHNNSPCSSMGSISTTAVTSTSSLADLSPSCSPVDQRQSLYGSAKVCSGSSDFTTSTLDHPVSLSITGSAQGGRPAAKHASSLEDIRGISVNNSHRQASSGTVVDLNGGVVDGDRRTKRSQSSQQLSSSEQARQSTSLDSWVSLQLLNLSSRATRLAIESRVQSLQRILRRMDECTKSPPSTSPIPEPRPPPNSTNNSVMCAPPPSPTDHPLKACSSEELVQMVYQRLENLRTATNLQGHLRPSTQQEPEGCENTNANHRSTRDASVTQNVGTVTDMGSCVCFREKSDVDVSDPCHYVEPDAMNCSHAVDTLRLHQRKGSSNLHEGRSHVTIDQADSAEDCENVNEACIKRDGGAVETPSTTEHTSETVCASEVLDKNVSVVTDNIAVDDTTNRGDSVHALNHVERGVATESCMYFKRDTAEFSESFDARPTIARGVSARIRAPKTDVSFSDSVSMKETEDAGENQREFRINIDSSPSRQRGGRGGAEGRGGGKGFCEDGKGHGDVDANHEDAGANKQRAVESEGTENEREEDEDAGSEGGVGDDSCTEDSVMGTDTGVQCDIMTSSAVQPSRRPDCHKSQNVPENLATEHVCKSPGLEEERSSGPWDGPGEVRYRRRVRSLERALQLERDLHTITRASLHTMASDHQHFRQQLLGLHHRGWRHRRASDRLHEMWSRVDGRSEGALGRQGSTFLSSGRDHTTWS